jgi:four helix bundle protein
VKRYAREYLHYLYNALGSCAQLDTQLFITCKRRYTTSQQIEEVAEVINHESRMLICLIRAIQRDGNDSYGQRPDQPRRF